MSIYSIKFNDLVFTLISALFMYLFGMAEKNNWEDKAEKWIKSI